MPFDYDRLYQEERHALGEPFQEFVDFFAGYAEKPADVLDVGCGQGRDALYIARQGHRVVGVDISPTGIAQMLEDAKAEGLAVEGVVADLADYVPQRAYDIVVVDRTLHMLTKAVRLQVLQRLCNASRPGGTMLIADEKSNLPAMKQLFEQDAASWTFIKQQKSYLFAQKAPSSP